jgi:galactokinase/mevalonate kinase-like predicted kinase
LAELHRILVPGGLAILAVPVIEGWDNSYENPAISTPGDRLLHFGQEGHLRRYGRDVRERIRSAGFFLAEFVASGDECADFALQPGERLFLARKPLKQNRVSREFAKIIASAPGRIDVGGRLDLPRYFFQFAAGEIGTTNIAISLRTTITYVNNQTDDIIVRDGQREESGCVQHEPANTALPYFWRAIHHFGAPGGIYTIHTQIPPQSGLGGSSAFVLALLGILASCKGDLLEGDDDKNRLLILAYLFENAIGSTSAGFQDYSASMWGNAHIWSWGAALSQRSLISTGEPICSPLERHLFDGRILVAFTGESHVSNRLGSGVGFELTPKERLLWLRVGQLGKRIGMLLRDRAWHEIASAIREEREVWLEVSGEQMSPKVQALIAAADACGVGSRFSGIPSGGTVWAIGSCASLVELRERWVDISANWQRAFIRTVRIDTGLELICDPSPVSELRPRGAVSLRG